MQRIITTDENGYKHAVLSEDGDTVGIPNDPPDVNKLDWEYVKKTLHNLLVDRNLTTLTDINKTNSGLANAVKVAIIPKIIELYKSEEV